MTKKYRKQRPITPGWVDSLIAFLEIVGFIGTIFGAIYALITWIF